VTSITLRNVEKRFGSVDVIRKLDLDLKSSEFVVFVGPSGCGKSTLLRMIAGLEAISGGELQIDGKRMNGVPPADRGIAMVFQSYALYPHMTVYKNLAFSLETARKPKAFIDEQVRRSASILQIEHLLGRYPKQLSGGQRQRVAIGRAIVREPKLFLFDEPLSNLDAELRVQMRVEIAKLHHQLGTTMIYVTHDQIEAMTMADRIVVMNAGRIEQVGSPLELYNAPANRFVAGFIGSPKMNFLEGRVEEASSSRMKLSVGGHDIAIDGQFQDPPSRGASITLGLRPEHLGLQGLQSLGEVRVQHVEQLGSSTLAHAALGDQPLSFDMAGQQLIALGAAVPLFFDPAAAHLFDDAGRAFMAHSTQAAAA
jgi:multiple sugar transport system ATP-binding protein